MIEDGNYWQGSLRHRLSRRALLRSGALAGLGLATGISIFGCGSKQMASTSSTGGEQPEYGGVLTYNSGGDPPNFDFISQSTYMTLNPIAGVYNNLVMFDPLDPNKIIGDLAEKWEASSDGKVYTFTLIKGVKFHDGKPCTSADVKATFDAVRNPPKGLVSPRKGSLAVVDGIETPDETTVRFVLKRAAPSLLTILAQQWMGIFPKHILDEKGNMEKDAIGTGPFMLKEYNRGNYVELVKNPNYHVKGRPYLDGIKYFIIPDPSTSMANFRTGQLLFFYGMTGEDAQLAQKEFGDKITIQSSPSYTFDALAFNSKRRPWDDVRVRQAISLAVDRQDEIKVVKQGFGGTGGFMPPSGPWALTQADRDRIPGYSGDPAANQAAAKKLLAEAGYANGFSTTLLTRKGASYEPLSVFLKDQLAKVGIDAKLDVQETAAAYDAFNNRAYDLGPWVHSIALDDPDTVFSEFYLCDSERNYSAICTKEVDDLFNNQSQTLNADERKKLVNQMEKTAMETYTRLIFCYSTRFIGLSNRVHNYKIHPSLYNNQRLQDVWLSKS